MVWTIGKVKITKIVEMELTGGTRFILPQATPQEIQAMPWLIPQFASPEGRLTMSVHSWVVETPSRRILVDTCIGNDKQGRGVPHWNGLDKPYLQDLARAGYPADSIDTVICTHLHVDHVGWNTKLVDGQWVPTFPNARYLFGRIEYEYWKTHATDAAHAAVFADSVEPVIDAGVVDLVASDAEIADEITLIPTPGHSPGHVALHIRSDGEEAVLSGDVAHHPCQMVRLDWSSSFDSDALLSIETRRRLFSRFADTPTLLFGGHFGPGRIVSDGDAFRLVAQP
ncbi:beta-lactamase domain protein [Rhodopseudomonas palustris TIE-1]|uniref:MBL fold metallo-hydrolase n=1 Tax=Rhodopseudomonas palustris TaxID=1076 RepID=UPI0001649616|nr:MBL fold metallo-hydrolase [Rhodopseudomonas palustris]ACF03400.1 beta-lactamase domain protein [Rhodopseudomonas palustris TIE-1]